jgi:hypothetical protein
MSIKNTLMFSGGLVLSVAVIMLIVSLITGCDQWATRKFGGTTSIELNNGQRLVNVTWKDSNIWVLAKDNATTPPALYTFQEYSMYGVLNGKVIIKEK